MLPLLKKPPVPELPAITLEGERITVRPPQRADYPQWATVRGKNRVYLQPFEPLWAEGALSEEHFNLRIERQLSDWRMGRAQAFLMFTKAGEMIGGVNINNICRGAAQFASLGYWLDEDRQGHGYMNEALELVMAYAFDTLKLHRLNAGTLLHNVRSLNLLVKCGFRKEGTATKYLEINGQWQDHILLGLNVDEWSGGQ